MKKSLIIVAICMALTIVPTQQSNAVVWVVIQQAIVKAIKAMDLMVQRLQNKTIWLQNAQKTLENEMTKLQLNEINDWVSKHKEQYVQYFDELKRVKQAISGYNKVKEVMERQVSLVHEYKTAFNLFLTPRTAGAFKINVWMDGPWVSSSRKSCASH